MSEEIWTNVAVRLPVGYETDPFIMAAVTELNDRIYDGEQDTELLADGTTWATWGGPANYGLNDEIRGAFDLLRLRGVPFDCHDEAKYEMTGTWYKWRPGMAAPATGERSESGPVVAAGRVAAWMDECDDPARTLGEIAEALALTGPAAWDLTDDDTLPVTPDTAPTTCPQWYRCDVCDDPIRHTDSDPSVWLHADGGHDHDAKASDWIARYPCSHLFHSVEVSA